ncbi:MAG: response regulator [Hydrocarboniphaga sp.]|uniref:sigma-54-dependent transcriptional regulator n=1 Tax=Hydrocarboniphaga sp. TaxID=2033016 RepID=UPI0026147238|nr:sigma-54 dependent transcriptional regulator [Hydrocarboniphaga sp.]MDB5972922.1 response regulator [Hydrocarboniphaga sp.]
MTRAAGKPPSISTALIVDDEADIRELIEITLLRMGVRTEAAADLAQARALLAEHHFDFCFTDMRLPDGSGIELVHEVQKTCPGMPIAVITAHGNAQAAVESLKAGAFDFVSKPVDLAILRKLVEAGLRLKAGDASAALGGAPTTADDSGGLLGRDPSIEHLRGLIERLARSQAPVHICGESGTGKELVARLIHQRGPRAAAAFVPVNCGAIPGELMESEFFGHLKGSFTGALRDKSGLFQAAEGGTLFLDEVADLPLHMQVKLLRALQERRVRQVGSESEMPVNVRIISATHRDLAALVASGQFRQDLYYRLNVIDVRTPPLRERRGDIPLLAASILERLSADSGQRPQLDADALSMLAAYDFPGNVRELENVLERAITLSDGLRIGAADLQLRAAARETGAPATAAAAFANTGDAAAPLDARIEEIEKRAIREALEKSRYNKTRAAELLGMSFRQLRYKLKKFQID